MKKLNEHAAALFESGDDQEVNNGLIIMNELIVPCLPLLLVDEMEEKDIIAVEDMRNRWCSYLGQEMERKSYSFLKFKDSYTYMWLHRQIVNFEAIYNLMMMIMFHDDIL